TNPPSRYSSSGRYSVVIRKSSARQSKPRAPHSHPARTRARANHSPRAQENPPRTPPPAVPHCRAPARTLRSLSPPSEPPPLLARSSAPPAPVPPPSKTAGSIPDSDPSPPPPPLRHQ